MGWTGQAPRFDGDKKQWLINEFTSENGDFRWTISDLSIKGSEAYCIYHQEDKKTGISVHEALVILISCRKEEWSYKEMGETVHPYYYNAPKKLLDKIEGLYPPFNEQAKQWRHKCREKQAKSKTTVKDGDVVKFDKPLSFGWFTEDTFTVEKHGAKTSFRTKNKTLCRITNWKDRDFRVLGNVHEVLDIFNKGE
jgi:hypothetical protein